LFDERLRLVIGVRIKQLMRMTVVEKTLEPKHIAVFGAAAMRA
jgi:hypothetical protein